MVESYILSVPIIITKVHLEKKNGKGETQRNEQWIKR